VQSVIIDGEAVVCDANGVPTFDKLHSKAHDDAAVLFAFDFIELDGDDWRPRPREERKAKLAKLLNRVSGGICFNEHLEGDGAIIFDHACRIGLEGIVSKRRDLPYRSGRSMLDQGEEPGEPGDAQNPGWDILKSQDTHPTRAKPECRVDLPRWITGAGAKRPHRFCDIAMTSPGASCTKRRGFDSTWKG
jgi:ATP dependent DNA ligase domain